MQSDSMWRLPDHPSKPFSFLFSTLLKLRHSRYPLPPRRGGWGMACDAWVGSAKRAKGPAASWSLRSAEWQMVKPHLHPYEVGYKWYIYIYVYKRSKTCAVYIYIHVICIYSIYIYWNLIVFFCGVSVGRFRILLAQSIFLGGRFLFVKAHSSPIHLPRIQKSIPGIHFPCHSD